MRANMHCCGFWGAGLRNTLLGCRGKLITTTTETKLSMVGNQQKPLICIVALAAWHGWGQFKSRGDNMNLPCVMPSQWSGAPSDGKTGVMVSVSLRYGTSHTNSEVRGDENNLEQRELGIPNEKEGLNSKWENPHKENNIKLCPRNCWLIFPAPLTPCNETNKTWYVNL